MSNFDLNLAIAIGINNYRNNIAELKTARPDAKKLANLLGTDYNYQVELITDETERKPSLTELRTLLTRWLPQQLQPPAHNNRLLFYFAGHGMYPRKRRWTERLSPTPELPQDSRSQKSLNLLVYAWTPPCSHFPTQPTLYSVIKNLKLSEDPE